MSELMMASAITDDPTKLIVAIPAAIAGIGAASKAFTIVHQSEKGVRTRGGVPMLKPEVTERIIRELGEKPDQLDIVAMYNNYEVPDYAEELIPDLPDLRDQKQVMFYEKALLSHTEPTPQEFRRMKRELKKADDYKKRHQEKVAELMEDDEFQEKGVYQIVGSGVVWLVPFVDRVVKINVANQSTPITDSYKVRSNDGSLVDVWPSFTWNVRPDGDNPYKALFEINNEKDAKLKANTRELEQTISSICMDALRHVLQGRSYEDIEKAETKEITKMTQERCKDDVGRFGVDLNDVWIHSAVYTDAERLAQAIESKRRPVSELAEIVAAISHGTNGHGTNGSENGVAMTSAETE